MKQRPGKTSSPALVAFASFIGTAVEWYDFFLYGAATALVFNFLFFPQGDPAVATIAAFGVYAVGFFARPVGGIVCGHFGDKIGRKSMLVLTLLLMGVATFLIGLLPGYAVIGIWAPILLVALRVVQGFGVGGEWGGAILMAVEHAPAEKRGFYGSWAQMGVPAGLLLSTAVLHLLSGLSGDNFLTWGWRIAFLISIVLVGVGLFIRTSVVESEDFTRVKETHKVVRLPIVEVLTKHRRAVLIAMGARLAENGGFYMFSVFVLTYGTQVAGFTASQVLSAVFIGSALEMCTIPIYGALSDRFGRKPLYLLGATLTALLAFPFFWLLDTQTIWGLNLAVILGLPVAHAAMYGPQASFFSELFSPEIRYSGASLGYQLASVFAGGLAPLAAVAILKSTGQFWPVSLMIIGMCVVTFIAVAVASETAVRTRAKGC